MQPYEIRQLSDGTIDYSNYHARPVSLLTPNMRRFCARAVSAKIWLIMVATVAALALIPMLAVDRAAGVAALKPQPAHVLREPVDVIGTFDPQKWQGRYGKSATRGHTSATDKL